MAVLLSILALALAVACGAYLIHSVAQGRPWALEFTRAVGRIPDRAQPATAEGMPSKEDEEEMEAALAA